MLALEVLTLTLGAVAMLLFLPRARRQRRPRQHKAQLSRPEDLERLERLLISDTSSAARVHSRLRPVLRNVAAPRLRRHGVGLDADEQDARALLGEPMWDLVRSERQRPEDARGPGLAMGELEEMIDRLEQL